MTGEQFHDALTLLPEDLIARTEEFRSRRPKIIPWKQYAAIAACFAVLLVSFAFVRNTRRQETTAKMTAAAPSSAVKEESADAAPAMEAAPEAASGTRADSGIPFVCVETPVNVHSTASFAHSPSATAITSREELDGYLSKWDRLYLLDTLRDACEIYREDWFASHDLLLIPVNCITSSCVVTDMTIADGVCQVIIDIGSEEAEQTNYHILLPIEKGTVSDPQNIIVIYNSDTTD